MPGGICELRGTRYEVRGLCRGGLENASLAYCRTLAFTWRLRPNHRPHETRPTPIADRPPMYHTDWLASSVVGGGRRVSMTTEFAHRKARPKNGKMFDSILCASVWSNGPRNGLMAVRFFTVMWVGQVGFPAPCRCCKPGYD